MEAIRVFTQGLCKPLLIFIIFYAALILFNITQFDGAAVLKNTLFLAFGAALIYALCSAGFETVAWIMLALYPFFFVSIIALLVVTQMLKTTVTDERGTSVLSGNGWFSNLFGARTNERRQLENIERELEGALSNVGSNASKCADAIIKPVVRNIQLYKLTPLQPIMCPTCTSTSTSS